MRWKLRRDAPPAETLHRHPGSAPQVGHWTAALGWLVRRGWRQLGVVVICIELSALSLRPTAVV